MVTISLTRNPGRDATGRPARAQRFKTVMTALGTRVTHARKQVKDYVVTTRTAWMMVGGFASFSTAGWGVDWRLGFVVIGISLFLLNFLVEGGKR